MPNPINEDGGRGSGGGGIPTSIPSGGVKQMYENTLPQPMSTTLKMRVSMVMGTDWSGDPGQLIISGLGVRYDTHSFSG